MRKLTTFCCFAAATSFLFFACQKSSHIETDLTAITDPESRQILEQTEKSLDYQHFTAHQELNETAQPSTTPTSSARFVLTYFSNFEEETEKSYSPTTFKSALLEVGLSETEAQQRTNHVFLTMNCSPTYLTETAQLLSPTLPSHTEGVFICELFKPYQASQTATFSECTSKNGGVKVFQTKIHATESVKEVNRLLGVCGSVAAYGDNRIELFFKNSGESMAASHLLKYQDVRLVLQETHGYNEGEAIYLKLILGELSEQEVWLLFNKDILPTLQKRAHFVFEQTKDSRLVRLFFRYNYLEIVHNTGRLGYTIYDLDGFEDFY